MEPAQPAERVPADDPTMQPERPAAPDAPAVPDDGTVPPPAHAPGRSGRSPKDMAISLLVLLIPIALLVAFSRLFLGGDEPTTVDPAPVVAQARTAGVFPVSEPVDLESGWRTVSARFQRDGGTATLRLGYLSPDGRGAQVVQSNVPPEQLLPAELTAQGRPQGQTELDGQSWQRYTGRGNEQALVLLAPDRTVIVVGDAREQELRDLADALR